jgi:adenosylcobinamide-phosphate synthase
MNYIIITFGYLWDLIFSEPKKIPHPVVLIGNLISLFEKKLFKEENTNKNKFLKGMLLNFLVLLIVFSIVFLIVYFASLIHPYIYILISGILISFTISTEALKKAAMEIYDLLDKNEIIEARKKVGMIVGRDTEKLNEEEISRAVIETVAENIVDGITSPLFYGMIGGAPLAFLYRAVNTMDSMVGYKNEKYLYFGRFSAKIDDVFNFIPARITSLLIIIIAFLHPGLNGKNALKSVIRDAHKHPSPNGGYTESAAAGALEIRLGGYNYYFGEKHFRAYMGENLQKTEKEKIPGIVSILYLTTFLWVVLAITIGFFIS